MITIEARRVPSLFITSMLLFAVGLLLFIALVNGQRDLAVLSLLVIVMAGGLRLWAGLSIFRIRCHPALDKNRIFRGEKLVLVVDAVNGKPLPVLLEVNVPADGLSSNAFSDEMVLKGEGSLLWYQMVHFQWELTAARRGVHEIGPLKIMSGDLFGFLQKESEMGEPFEVVVYPKLVPLGPFSFPKRDFFGIPGGESPVNDPVYILGTTDYHHGRPAKYIHWKASARHNRLQEKVFEPTQQEKVLLVVDVDQFARDHAEEAFERNLEVVASLTVRLERQGCAIGLLTNGIIKGASPVLSITRSPRQVSGILDVLARLKMEPRERLINMMRYTVNMPWGTSCVYFALEEDEATNVVREYLKRRRIPVVFFTFEAASALRRDKSVDASVVAGIESIPAKEGSTVRKAQTP